MPTTAIFHVGATTAIRRAEIFAAKGLHSQTALLPNTPVRNVPRSIYEGARDDLARNISKTENRTLCRQRRKGPDAIRGDQAALVTSSTAPPSRRHIVCRWAGLGRAWLRATPSCAGTSLGFGFPDSSSAGASEADGDSPMAERVIVARGTIISPAILT
jgi:hypothetical protein